MKYKTDLLTNLLKDISSKYRSVTFSSSFSAEDMVITDVINQCQLPISIFTIDTGRLPKETYDLMHLIKSEYRIPFAIYSPDASDLETFVNSHGCNAFYQSVDYRKLCCKIRKIGPIKRALQNNDLWLTGLRKEQSVTRQNAEEFEFDQQFNIEKCNPLLNWTSKEVWSYIRANDVPYNVLHDHGYPSVGCEPCTRKIEATEDERAGRWWWEKPESKECGLHVVNVARSTSEVS